MLSDRERSAFEQRLRDAFAREGAWQAAELRRLLGDPPDIGNVPDAWWATADARLLDAISPIMLEMTIKSAGALGLQQGIVGAVDWSMVNARAATWAQNYAGALVKGIDATTQAGLQDAVSTFFKTPEMDLKTLGAQVGDMFGPARGDMIAVTEATRAAAEGEQALVDTIRLANPKVTVVGIFLTSRDEHVCTKICIPLNGVQDDGHGNFVNPLDGKVYRIPAHPFCRCGRGTVIAGLPTLGGL